MLTLKYVPYRNITNKHGSSLYNSEARTVGSVRNFIQQTCFGWVWKTGDVFLAYVLIPTAPVARFTTSSLVDRTKKIDSDTHTHRLSTWTCKTSAAMNTNSYITIIVIFIIKLRVVRHYFTERITVHLTRWTED